MNNKIMIIDDEADTLVLLKRFLEERGFEVQCFRTGKEGLDEVKNFNPHLILLDWRMPEIDGMEVFGRLRLDQETAHIPVMFITARTMMGDIEKAMEIGVDDYICKPLELETLLHRIRKLLKVGV